MMTMTMMIMMVMAMMMLMMWRGCVGAKRAPAGQSHTAGRRPRGARRCAACPLAGRPPPPPLLARRLRTVPRVVRAPAHAAPPRQDAVPWRSKDGKKDDRT